MSISSRFAVATHILTLLALENKGNPTTSEYLAGSAGTNPVVIRRILSPLDKAGLVKTCSGVGGGVQLARDPRQITLRDVFQAVERPNTLFSLGKRKKNLSCICSRNIDPIMEAVFQGAETAVSDTLSQTTLAQVAQQVIEAEGRD
ncbi:MAG: Rrf2 family transcriptional regulator [Anaerolineales bacterium]|nr:Rrf2 family transcriptional regulator [Anaerolineales bacterium]MCB8952568.1 Rrf2 family transcriptional regulator [Ardenticatenales bacterium]